MQDEKKTNRERARETLAALRLIEGVSPSAEDVLAAALESARVSGVEEARRAALEEAAGKADAVATGARVSARYFRNAGDEMRTEKWAAAEGAALDIRDSILALIAGAGEGAASAPHPMEAAARLVDEWSAANFRTSAERPDPSALLDLVKRLAARKEGA